MALVTTGPMDLARHRIVCGLDFGTTNSGFAYGNTANISNVELVNSWPGHSGTVNKVPTVIAYPSENISLKSERWGFTVGGHLESHSWFKLLLDKSTKVSKFDDPDLNEYLGSGMLRVPADKSARDVCGDYLRLMREYVFDHLRKKYGKERFEMAPHDFYITVPAIWSDAAKSYTKDAALAAGFGSREGDTVNIIAEPEAAALSALKPHLDPKGLDPVNPGDVVLVCDCGGGTVDITTYKITSCVPKLEFEEVVIGCGGKCGSTFIDRNFVRLMEKTFGDAFTAVPLRKRGPGSNFMREFEKAKKAFSRQRPAYGLDDIEIEGLDMKFPSCDHWDPDEAIVKLSWTDMQKLFDPVIDEIIHLIEQQRGILKKFKEVDMDISRIILVGGFGDSDYLNERLKIWCVENGNKSLTCPPQCQAAIAKGAVIHGLEGLKPSSRLARRHYGYEISMPFRPGIDPEKKGYIDEYDGRKYCSGRLKWLIRKGQAIDENTLMEHKICSNYVDGDSLINNMLLYSCSTDTAPEYTSHLDAERVGFVKAVLSKNDIKGAPRKYNKERKKYIKLLAKTITLNLAPIEGTFTVKTTFKGKVVGHTSIKFDSD